MGYPDFQPPSGDPTLNRSDIDGLLLFGILGNAESQNYSGNFNLRFRGGWDSDVLRDRLGGSERSSVKSSNEAVKSGTGGGGALRGLRFTSIGN